MKDEDISYIGLFAIQVITAIFVGLGTNSFFLGFAVLMAWFGLDTLFEKATKKIIAAIKKMEP